MHSNAVPVGPSRRPPWRAVVGIDVGAGSGAKMAVFDRGRRKLGEGLLDVGRYGASAEEMADALAEAVRALMRKLGLHDLDIGACGIACPGLLQPDGTFTSISNLPFLKGRNLGILLGRRLGVRVRCENDADAGATAEWWERRCELLYWVLGGGWGGAWIDGAGAVRFQSLAWDGNDASLHLTSEPGYATPIRKDALDAMLRDEGSSFEALEAVWRSEQGRPDAVLTGPSGRRDCVRAEAVVSGPGRWRVFYALAAHDRRFWDALSSDDAAALRQRGTAGRVIDALSRSGNRYARAADRVFGRALAEAAAEILKEAWRDGAPADIPVFMAGGPSRALPLFGPIAEEALDRRGMRIRLRLSILAERGINANLEGAAILAEALAADADKQAGSPRRGGILGGA